MKTDPCAYCDFIGPFVYDEQPVRELHRSWHELVRTCTRAFAPLLAVFGDPGPGMQKVLQVHAQYGVPYTDAIAAPRMPELIEGQLYEVDTENATGIYATWSPVDGIRANHPWLGTDETRYRQDYVIRARPVQTDCTAASDI